MAPGENEFDTPGLELVSNVLTVKSVLMHLDLTEKISLCFVIEHVHHSIDSAVFWLL